MAEEREERVGRRKFLLGATAVAAAAWAGEAAAEHHDPAEESGHAGHSAGGRYGALVEAAQDCVSTGDQCLAHCLQEFEAGRFELSVCASRVQELTAACRALSQLAAMGSKHTGSFAKATAEVCRSCEDECRKHAKMHEICKACADHCASCIEECEKHEA